MPELLDLAALRARYDHDRKPGLLIVEIGQMVRHATHDVRVLVDEVERLRAEVERLREDRDGRWAEQEALARGMGTEWEQVSAIVQTHAPYNGTTCCDSTTQHRTAIVEFLKMFRVNQPAYMLLDALENAATMIEGNDPETLP